MYILRPSVVWRRPPPPASPPARPVVRRGGWWPGGSSCLPVVGNHSRHAQTVKLIKREFLDPAVRVNSKARVHDLMLLRSVCEVIFGRMSRRCPLGSRVQTDCARYWPVGRAVRGNARARLILFLSLTVTVVYLINSASEK